MSGRRRSPFPDPLVADAQGLVATTEDLSAELLLEAYHRGIFPWSESPVRWFCPNPRAVFVREHIRLPRRLAREQRRSELTVTFDTAFGAVIEACAASHEEQGVWLGPRLQAVYAEVHSLGFAHSVEVWQRGALVGGLYGVQLGGLFAGESMFYRVSNASKLAFAYLIDQLDRCGTVLIDAQVLNPHTERLGALQVRRSDYLAVLPRAIAAAPLTQAWPTDPPPLGG